MKKIISLALAILMMAVLLIPVSAAAGSNKFGDVKKVDDSDIDMSTADMSEPAWQNALKVPLERNRDANAAAAKGNVYLLWSDTGYYAFFDITDTTPVSDPSRAANLEPWVTDSVEFFIDETNEGVHCEQFRVDRDGSPSYYPKAGEWTAGMLIGVTAVSTSDPVPASYMSWKVKAEGDKYYVKLKVTFFDSVTAKDVGVHFQINDVEEMGGGNTCTWPAANEADSWAADVYGYVTLINEPAYIPVIEEVATETAPAAEENKAPVAAAVVSAPQTSDMTIIMAIGTMLTSGAALLISKKRK